MLSRLNALFLTLSTLVAQLIYNTQNNLITLFINALQLENGYFKIILIIIQIYVRF
jgi:uncharacterized membrane protein